MTLFKFVINQCYSTKSIIDAKYLAANVQIPDLILKPEKFKTRFALLRAHQLNISPLGKPKGASISQTKISKIFTKKNKKRTKPLTSKETSLHLYL
jgi:hypothetical protein